MSHRRRNRSRHSSHSTDDGDCRTLYVGVMKSKFPNYITSTHLQQHFSDFEDDIKKAIIIRDHETKESKGFGLVTFTSHEAAENAMYALKGTKLRDKFPLFIKFDKKSQLLKSESTPRGSCELFFKAMKSRLPNFIHNRHIRDHFAEFDTDIVSVIIARDNDTKQSKGFGFIKFTTHQVAMEAKKKLHGSMLLSKFQLFVDMRKPSTSSSVAGDAQDGQALCSKTFQLTSLVIEGRHTAFTSIGSQNNTRVVERVGGIISISGYCFEDVERSWKEIEDFIEQSLTLTRSIQVSCGCAKFLLQKRVSELLEFKKQCKIMIPPIKLSEESITITIQGKKANAEEVTDKLKKLTSKCHVELFYLQCPKKLARFWKQRWDRLSSENEREPDLLINFMTTQVSAIKGGKNTVTVLIAGTDQHAVQALRTKVLKDENSSHMTMQRLKLTNEEFEVVSSNFNLLQLEVRLELRYSTIISLESQEKIVELQAPSSLETNLEAAKKEVMKCIGTISRDQPGTTVMHHQFEDVVVGMLLTTKPSYFKAIEREASTRSVTVHIQKLPKPSIQIHGSCKDVEATKQKICSLETVAKTNIEQMQIKVAMKMYHLLTTNAFSKHQDEMLENKFVRVTYPPQQGVLRQEILRTHFGHMITLQLCVGDIKTEDVDAVIVDLNQAESLTDLLFRQKFKEFVQNNGTPKVGSVSCHESGSLPCQNVIVAPTLKWKGEPGVSIDSLFSPYKESLSSSASKGFSIISFLLSGNMSNDASTMLLLNTIDTFCVSHHKMSIHTIRIAVSSDSSAVCTSMFDERVSKMQCSTTSHVQQVQASSCSSSLSAEQWQWRDDKKQFTSYPSDISDKLSKAKLKNPNGKCVFTIDGKIYIVDFSTMKQKNHSTGYTRDVHCVNHSSLPAESNVSVQWYYRDDQNILTPYTKTDSDFIESMYNGISKENTHILISGRKYCFDFTKMKQINSSTQHSRRIQREVSGKKTEQDSPSLSSENQKLVITFRGPKENLLSTRTLSEMKLKQICYTKAVPLPQAASENQQFLQKLHTIIRKHTVDYRVKEDPTVEGNNPHKPCKIFEIEGPEHAVHKAISEIQEEIIRFHSESTPVAGAAIEYPKEWEHQTKTTETFNLSTLSEERRKVASSFHQTLPKAVIMRIQRIQNKWLWEKYEQSKRRIAKKNSGRVNEKQLFHGSRKASAEEIYDSEEGFDMRFSSEGLWGRANYFAADASYSDLYAYSRPGGSKELFVAKVLTGDSYTSQSDPSLRMPPEKPHSDSKVQLKQLRYDTVNGVTKGTQVYMTYSNEMAYPAYLIVYCPE